MLNTVSRCCCFRLPSPSRVGNGFLSSRLSANCTGSHAEMSGFDFDGVPRLPRWIKAPFSVAHFGYSLNTLAGFPTPMWPPKHPTRSDVVRYGGRSALRAASASSGAVSLAPTFSATAGTGSSCAPASAFSANVPSSAGRGHLKCDANFTKSVRNIGRDRNGFRCEVIPCDRKNSTFPRWLTATASRFS